MFLGALVISHQFESILNFELFYFTFTTAVPFYKVIQKISLVSSLTIFVYQPFVLLSSACSEICVPFVMDGTPQIKNNRGASDEANDLS